MPSGGKNTRRTRGQNASLDKTKDKATDTNVYTTLARDSDVSFDDRGEGEGSRDALETTIETPGAPKATRVQRRPETPNEDHQTYEVQGTLRILLDTVNQQREDISEVAGGHKIIYEIVKSLTVANQAFCGELDKIKAELAEARAELVRMAAAVEEYQKPKPTLPRTQQKCTTVAIPTQGPTNRERVVVVGLGKAATALKQKPLAAIKELAQKELSSKAETKGIKVVGISAIVGERLEIQTESKEQADNARRDQSWTIVLGKDARVRQPAWYPIKVDGVARANICKKTGNGWQFKQGLESLINKSNTRPDLLVKVMKVHWLSKPSEKAAGSMAVYLDSREVAQQVIREGTFLIGANATYPAPFVSQERPVRCYRCNQYGHKQSKCSAENPGCGKCAGAHETINCPGTAPDKCITCEGAHKVVDLSCEAWQKEKEKVEQRSRKETNRA
jgi:Tfp pilus assembly protein PilE